MLRSLIFLFLIIFLMRLSCFGQEPDPGPGYQMMLIKNPALTGSGSSGTIRLSYLNFYPGNSYNLHTVNFTYDSYFQGLHGGVGVYMTDDYLGGIINDFRGGVSYAYFLQAGKDFFINAGLSASVYHRGFNFSSAILPDQIDPLGGVTIPSSEVPAVSGKTIFDVCAGFLFTYGNLTGGFSVNHLAQPDLSLTGLPGEQLKRKLLVHISGDFPLGQSKSLMIEPLTYVEIQGGYVNGGMGAALQTKYLAINAVVLGDSGKNLNIQSGFSFSTGRIYIYYNYRFNAVSGNSFMPLSLLHETGLAFSLNNVEKRNAFKTINFPKL
jgi:type IX secretion system PorP/SprF family membrane protein